MKWLYERRKLRFWRAQEYERVLRNIAEGDLDAAQQADDALREAERRELELGVWFDHGRNRGTNEYQGGNQGGPQTLL